MFFEDCDGNPLDRSAFGILDLFPVPRPPFPLRKTRCSAHAPCFVAYSVRSTGIRFAGLVRKAELQSATQSLVASGGGSAT